MRRTRFAHSSILEIGPSAFAYSYREHSVGPLRSDTHWAFLLAVDLLSDREWSFYLRKNGM
jgi:hypothetical protein